MTKSPARTGDWAVAGLGAKEARDERTSVDSAVGTVDSDFGARDGIGCQPMEAAERIGLGLVLEAMRACEAAGADAERVCAIVVEKVSALGTIGALGFVRAERRIWEGVTVYSTRDGLVEAISEMLGGRTLDVDDLTLAGQVVRTGKTIRVADVGSIPALHERFPNLRDLVVRHELGAFVWVPVRSLGVVIGTLGVGRCGAGTGPFSDDDVAIIEILASYAAHAVERARLVHAEGRLRDALAKSNERLRVASRTEVVGRLVAGVAHDLNNVFSVVVSYGDMLLDDIDEPSLREDLAEVRRAGERGSELVRQMLGFARHEVTSTRLVDIAALVVSMRPLLKRVLFEDTELSIEVDSTVGTCRVDPSHVEQVLLDLALNARDSMPCGGRIELRVAHVVPDGRTSRRSGPHVLVSLRSSGGRSREIDPFFTSAPGTTDMGLAVPRSVVARYGGNLAVRVDDAGAVVFELLFPCTEDVGKVDSAREGPNQRATVLVVDDDAPVRKVLAAVIARAGHHVVEAVDGRAALEVVATEVVDVLVTDLIMPGMSGYELAERSRTIRPTLSVVTVSGYPPDVTRTRRGSDPGVFLAKPIAASDLISAIGAALASARNATVSITR